MNDATIVRKVRCIDTGEPLILWAPPDHDVAGYAVETAICENPQCSCTDMWLSIRHVTRLDGGRAEIQQAILGGQVSSDGTGVKLDAEGEGALANEAVAWIGEQLERQDHRAWFQERWRRGRGQVGDPAYPPGAPPEDRDGMVFFSEVFPYDFDVTVFDDGRHYFAEDQYCLEPACTCDEIAVQFVDLNGIGPVGYVRVSLGRLGAPKIHGPDLVQRLWRKLVDRHGAKRLRERFQRMRQVAQQRPRSGSSSAAAQPARDAKVQRNASCPCGSGKKFKRCCGV